MKAERIGVTKLTSRQGRKVIVFVDADEYGTVTYGNNTVGFGFPTPEQVADADDVLAARPYRDEFAGIARGMKAGAL